VAQRAGRGIAVLFHNRGTRRGCVVSSTTRPHFTPGERHGTILQEAGWAPGPVWTGGTSRPHRDSIPDRPARSSDAIPTELPGPLIYIQTFYLKCKIFRFLNLIYIYISGTLNQKISLKIQPSINFHLRNQKFLPTDSYRHYTHE
jgi:hypothetical protein